jgi:hypothetical protein
MYLPDRARLARPPNKGMKLTKPGELRSFAAYPRCSTDAKWAEDEESTT